jgi:uncharacterized protein (TIGR00255 family)
MRSMTGYGQAEDATVRATIAVTVRGVNHRYLDVSIRLRDEAKASEGALRELVARVAERGRVEIGVEQQRLGDRSSTVEIDRGAVEALHAASRELAERGLLSGELSLADLFRLPDVVRVQHAEEGWGEAEQTLLLAVATRALAQFTAGRESEGARLRVVLDEKLAGLAALRERLLVRRTAVVPEMRETLRRRLEEALAGRELDATRLEQEVALLVDKSDVSEELDRLAAHLEHFREILGSGGAIGKRLDFLSQELFRELNTLGSKCRDAEMTRMLLDAKVVCEQLREQVQNVE